MKLSRSFSGNIKLHQLNESHFEALFDFESRNRNWFELFVPPRPETYKLISGFYKATNNLLLEQNKGESYFFVGIKGEKIVSRANLVDIENGSAEVGYRVCGQEIGKGYATNSLGLLIDFAKNSLCLKQLTAKTTTNNVASIKLLQNLDFIQAAVETEKFYMNGESVSFVHFKKQIN